MNPEEGELRAQFVDRFGLSVVAQSEISPGERSQIVLHRLEFDLPDDVLSVPAHQVVLSMFRLTEQGLRALDRQRYDEAVAAGLRARRASQGRHRASPRSGEEINDAEQIDDGSPKQPRLL
jgi:Mg-chelatase subunit ChlI